jgi:hypothetical protein
MNHSFCCQAKHEKPHSPSKVVKFIKSTWTMRIGLPAELMLMFSGHRSAINIYVIIELPLLCISTVHSWRPCLQSERMRSPAKRSRGKGDTSNCWQTHSVHNNPILEQVEFL